MTPAPAPALLLAARPQLLGAACRGAAPTIVRPADAERGGTVVRESLRQVLPGVDGRRLHVALVEVTYPPGDGSPPHRHHCPVLGYVVAGALRFGAGNARDTVLHAGAGFFERSGDLHRVSSNASRVDPVTFLATFLCDHDGPRTSNEVGTPPAR